MKLLIVANSSLGLYKFRKEIIESLAKKGDSIKILTPDRGKIEELESLGCEVAIVDIDRRGKNILSEIKLLLKYIVFIRKYKPDKVITYTIKPNIYCGIITRIYNIDFYPNITGLGTAFQKDGFFKELIIKIYRIALKKAKKVFFENKSNENVFIEKKICSRDKSVVLNGAGVNLNEYKFEQLNPLTSINFLFMGRIMKEKGIDELFEAIEQIKSKYPNINFDILGGLEEKYKTKIDELEFKNLITYHGMVDDVRPYIKNSHCILLPSYHEGMSNTLLEGAAIGRALITSDIPGCREVVKNNINGFLHRVKDASDLQCKIEKFISLSNDKKISFGKESRKIVEKEFAKEKIVDITIKNIFNY
ncbi:glycosyltransferase family 4 protein [Clostridium perfringens]|nr:glycosyltransferase family 4 protein [Clostridium perfringens]